MPSSGSENVVKRRRLFYVPGYDPVPPRRYRELYRQEAAKQAAISGYEIDLAPKEKDGPFGWCVTGELEGSVVKTDVDVLVWSDIVRASMSSHIPATYWQMLRTVWIYFSSGALWRLMRLRKGPVIAALYPVVMLIFQAALAIGLGVMAALAILDYGNGGLAVTGVALVVGLGLCAGVLRWFRTCDGRLYVYYLMHDFAFSARWNGAYPPELETRIDIFASQVAEALKEEVDEVLIIGHSSGAYVAVSVLADLVRSGRVSKPGPTLSFLSLGQVVPMVSFLPEAYRLRADLKELSSRSDLCWVDVSAPGDGCAFALCDPVAVSGVAPAEKHGPLVVSAAFTQTLSPETRAALRWRFFRLHFQYLCAFDQPGHYDYFRITAGPLTLKQRYSGKSASQSRIDVPVSKYRSVAA